LNPRVDKLLQIDPSGDTIDIFDPVTGEVCAMKLFVAAYTCATRILRLEGAINAAIEPVVPVGNLIRLASEAESRNVSIL
jgi:hypothetical protein